MTSVNRAGMSTNDYLVKLTSQFAWRKSVVATFFFFLHKKHMIKHDILCCWLSWTLFDYSMPFLSGQVIQVGVGNVCSNPRNLQMDIPHKSVVAPLLLTFCFFICPDLILQCWSSTTYRCYMHLVEGCNEKNNAFTVSSKHGKLYWNELVKLNNELVFSPEKNHFWIQPWTATFLQDFGLCCRINSKWTNFFRIISTSKLSWNYHVEYILTKARKL